MFDTHCHPQFSHYDTDRDEIIKRALTAGIFMICVGTDLELSKKAIALAEQHKGIWASVGLHPNDIERYDRQSIAYGEFEELFAHPKVVAVGEVGLDYYRTTDEKLQRKQKEVLKQFIELAIIYTKPLILHCRDGSALHATSAHLDLLNILTTYSAMHTSKLHGVVHSFTSTWDTAQRYLTLGFSLGFNGIITFARDYDEAAIKTPLDRILLETDSPYLTPVPHRGKRNEPLHVALVAQKIAELKNTSADKIAQQTTRNAQKLFNIDFK